MGNFYYDIDDGDDLTESIDPIDFPDSEAAIRSGIKALVEIAEDKLPDGDNRRFRLFVKDGDGNAIFEASLIYSGRRL